MAGLWRIKSGHYWPESINDFICYSFAHHKTAKEMPSRNPNFLKTTLQTGELYELTCTISSVD